MTEHWFNEIRNTLQEKNLSKLEQGLQRTGEKRWLQRPTRKIQISVYLLCYSLLISLVFEAHIQRQRNSLVYSTCVNWSCWKAICPRLQPAKKRKKNHQLWRNKHWMQRFCRDKELLLLWFATFWQLPFKRSFSILRARCKKMSCTGLKVREHGRRFLKFLISEKHINHETTSDCEIYWPSHDGWPAGKFS